MRDPEAESSLDYKFGWGDAQDSFSIPFFKDQQQQQKNHPSFQISLSPISHLVYRLALNFKLNPLVQTIYIFSAIISNCPTPPASLNSPPATSKNLLIQRIVTNSGGTTSNKPEIHLIIAVCLLCFHNLVKHILLHLQSLSIILWVNSHYFISCVVFTQLIEADCHHVVVGQSFEQPAPTSCIISQSRTPS